LAGDIGYTPGTLYNHFEDLDDVILRLNARELERLRGKLIDAMETAEDPRARVHALAAAYVRFAEEEPRLFEALTGFRRTKPGPPPEWFLAEAGGLLALLTETLQPLLPHLDAEAQDYESRRLWASIHGICALAAGGSIGRALVEPMDRMVRDLVDLQCEAWARDAASA
jgi:AcrR family transcriptional regulator